MVYWAIYDISKNKQRTRVANLCKDYGLQRVQKSTFLGDLTRNKAEMLAVEIKKIINGKIDKVFVFPASKEEHMKKLIIGKLDESFLNKRSVIFND